MNLKFAVRRKDIKHGHIQEKIAQSSTAVSKSLQTLQNCRTQCTDKKTKAQIREAMKTCLDTVKLNTAANQEISQLRRTELHDSLNPQFKAICKNPATETTELFGDKMAERVKEINELNKMGLDLTGKHTKTDYKSRYDPNSPKSDHEETNKTCDKPFLCFRQECTGEPLPTSEDLPQEQKLQPGGKGKEPRIQKTPFQPQNQRAMALNVSSSNTADWENFKSATIQRGAAETNEFKAGRLKGKVTAWKE